MKLDSELGCHLPLSPPSLTLTWVDFEATRKTESISNGEKFSQEFEELHARAHTEENILKCSHTGSFI